MNIDIEKVKETGLKTKAALTAVGLGISAMAGATFLDDNPASNGDVSENFDTSAETVQEINSQVDENKNKLDSLAASDQSSTTDYSKYGC